MSDCECGKPVQHKRSGQCHACYLREWKTKRKVVGRALRSVDDWFDHEAVRRAWSRWRGATEVEVGRKLTATERLYLCYLALLVGADSARAVRDLIGTDLTVAQKVIDDIRSGDVQVWERDALGRAVSPLPVP